MEIVKQQENTSLNFYILDYKAKCNLFTSLKIKNSNNDIDIIIDCPLFHKNIKSNMQIESIVISLCNKQTTVSYTIQIISNQNNNFYIFVNQNNNNIIDFRYKNYCKKKNLKKILLLNLAPKMKV